MVQKNRMKRKLNNIKRKEDILKLRKEGKTYKEIEEELGCSKSVISYHCGEDKSEKKRVKKRNKSEKHKLSRKVTAFKCRTSRTTFRTKLKTFKRRKGGSRTHALVNNISKNFTVKDVIAKFETAPFCYLTGKPLNINRPDTYHFDHIVPTSKGGTNNLSNLGICTREANYAKGDLNLEELYVLCQEILDWKQKNSKE